MKWRRRRRVGISHSLLSSWVAFKGKNGHCRKAESEQTKYITKIAEVGLGRQKVCDFNATMLGEAVLVFRGIVCCLFSFFCC